jgi:hypothetical protein
MQPFRRTYQRRTFHRVPAAPSPSAHWSLCNKTSKRFAFLRRSLILAPPAPIGQKCGITAYPFVSGADCTDPTYQWATMYRTVTVTVRSTKVTDSGGPGSTVRPGASGPVPSAGTVLTYPAGKRGSIGSVTFHAQCRVPDLRMISGCSQTSSVGHAQGASL